MYPQADPRRIHRRTVPRDPIRADTHTRPRTVRRALAWCSCPRMSHTPRHSRSTSPACTCAWCRPRTQIRTDIPRTPDPPFRRRTSAPASDPLYTPRCTVGTPSCPRPTTPPRLCTPRGWSRWRTRTRAHTASTPRRRWWCTRAPCTRQEDRGDTRTRLFAAGWL